MILRFLLPLLLVTFLSACIEREFLNQFDSKVPKTLSTSVSPVGSGQIIIAPSAPNYKTGEAITLTPVPSQHWVFQKWDGDASGTSVPFSLTMDSNKSVVAVFVKKNYPLSVTIQGEGTVSETIVSSPTGREYPHGTIVRLIPLPQQGWVFDGWGGDLGGTDSPKNITVDQEKNVTAKFIKPAISSLACVTATNNGILTNGFSASGVSTVISYTGGDGSTHNGQTIASTGITGLTASLAPGTFANGNGTLTYVITGTPSGVGTASFAINIGNQTCTVSRTVNQVGSISSLNCGSTVNNGVLTVGTAANEVSSSIPYSGGNGNAYSGQTVASTGVTGLTATLAEGSFANGGGSLVYTITGTPSSSGTASFELSIGGQTCTLSRIMSLPAGSISSLNCASATNAGTLVLGSQASGVSSTISYSGGNGGTYTAQNIPSTGVSGLTATLPAESFANGNGTLVFTISGIPTTSGTANFQLTLGGQSCTLSRSVTAPIGSISGLLCGTAVNIGTLIAGSATIGASSSITYTGGNGGTHNGQTVASTGVTGLTATLAPGTFANGSGSLLYTLAGTPSASGTATFAITVGGQTCTISRTVSLPAGSISSVNCSSATNTGILVINSQASGVSSLVPYTGGNGGSHTGQSVTSYGVFGLTATLSAGSFLNGSGSLLYTITGIPTTSGTANFLINVGGQTCIISRAVTAPVGSIGSLSCATAINSGTLLAGSSAIGVSSSISYTGGNGGTHNGQTVASTGVTGLTATLAPGSFANGSGSFLYTINGTPSSSGTANFAISIGGQTCILTRTVTSYLISQYPAGSVFCASGPTEIKDVINPKTGKTWMDRNLGATRAATSSTDTQAYGDLYQWGRRGDGHQCRNSPTSTNLSSSSNPTSNSFFLSNSSPGDWLIPQNNNLWQGINGINNPCPSGYRLPTSAELNTERLSWSTNNGNGAFNSPLRFTLGGFRGEVIGTLDAYGEYWSSTAISIYSNFLFISNNQSLGSNQSSIGENNRVFGKTVRCIKN